MIVSNFPQSGSEAQSGGFVQVTGTSVAKTETCYLTKQSFNPGISQSQIFGGSYGNGTVAIGAADGYYYYSTNGGTTWTQKTLVSGYNTGNIRFLNNQFIAMVEGGATYVSSDGITWTKKGTASVGAGSSYAYCIDIVYFNNKYVVNFYRGNSGNKMVSSSDLITWTDITPSQGISEYSYLFIDNNTLYVSASDGKTLYSTTNLSSWTKVYTFSGGQTNMHKVNNTYIVTGSGYIATSSNLTSWTTHSAPNSAIMWNIFYRDGAYCIFDDESFVYRTTNFTDYEVICAGAETGSLYSTSYSVPFYVEELNAIFHNIYAVTIYKYSFETNYKTTFSMGIDKPTKGQIVNLLPSFSSSSAHDEFYIGHSGGSYKIKGKVLKNTPIVLWFNGSQWEIINTIVTGRYIGSGGLSRTTYQRIYVGGQIKALFWNNNGYCFPDGTKAGITDMVGTITVSGDNFRVRNSTGTNGAKEPNFLGTTYYYIAYL